MTATCRSASIPLMRWRPSVDHVLITLRLSAGPATGANGSTISLRTLARAFSGYSTTSDTYTYDGMKGKESIETLR